MTDVQCDAASWTSWEPDSACLNGKQTFTRKCRDYNLNDYESVIFATRCPGNSTKDVECDWIWSNWSEWLMCSTNCGPGDTTRTRTCNSTIKSDCELFTELQIETTECQLKECDITWSTWSKWSGCYSMCRSDKMTRSRTCTPRDDICPMNEEFETSYCNITIGSFDWSDWSTLNECSALTIFVSVFSSCIIILLVCISCRLKHKRKISRMCACIKCEKKNDNTFNDDFTDYAEYCRTYSTENAIGHANNQTNGSIDSNSGYEEDNHIQITKNKRYQKTSCKNNTT